jgi:hypothetical protein
MRATEDLAVAQARTLLVLDTATENGAAELYEGLGFILLGESPDYPLTPRGRLTATLIYWNSRHRRPGRAERTHPEIGFSTGDLVAPPEKPTRLRAAGTTRRKPS